MPVLSHLLNKSTVSIDAWVDAGSKGLSSPNKTIITNFVHMADLSDFMWLSGVDGPFSRLRFIHTGPVDSSIVS